MGLTEAVEKGSPSGRRRWLRAALLAAAATALVAVIGWLEVRPGLLTDEALAEARARWEANGPASYRLEMRLSGAIQDVRRIEVRDGEVVAMTTDGAEVPRSVWEHWSVPALFSSLATELANAREPRAIFGGGGTQPANVVLRARFDSDWGYPIYFLRHVSGSFLDTSWKVVALESIGDGDG